MTTCERVGSWAASLRLTDLPETVARRARLQTLSMLAAARAGEQAASGVAAAAPEGRLGEVYCGAAASIAHDWDDYLFMGHPGHSAVWAARAFSPDPDRALLAQVAGNEVGGRLGAALSLGPHNGQFWSAIHAASAAATAGVAIGLHAEALAHALAIALYQPPYGLWPGFMGPATKLLTAAEPAVQGARAAQLAAAGVRGSLDIIEAPRGLLTHLSFAPRPAMLEALGRVWLTDTLAFKPFPGCAYLQAAVEAVLAADADPQDIAEIRADAGILTMGMERVGSRAGLGAIGVNFSVARSLAVAAIAGRLTHTELAPAYLAHHRESIEQLAGRVRVVHDWDMTLDTLRGFHEGGAGTGDVPLRAWLRVLRRGRELHMDEASLSGRDVRRLIERPMLFVELLRLVRGPADGLAGIDTETLRMRFPCRLQIKLRSGRTLESLGAERGSCGRSLPEQRAVVEERCLAVGLREADLPLDTVTSANYG